VQKINNKPLQITKYIPNFARKQNNYFKLSILEVETYSTENNITWNLILFKYDTRTFNVRRTQNYIKKTFTEFDILRGKAIH
jgi:hypothetical protein